METIKVFLGMEFGRFDGYEYGKVLKTYANGDKLVFLDFENDEEDNAWDELYIATADEKFGWYAISSKSVRVDFGNFNYGTSTFHSQFER